MLILKLIICKLIISVSQAFDGFKSLRSFANNHIYRLYS